MIPSSHKHAALNDGYFKMYLFIKTETSVPSLHSYISYCPCVLIELCPGFTFCVQCIFL